jgi:predicted ATPase
MLESRPAFSVDASRRLIRFGAESLSLDAAEFEILAQLIDGAGRPQTGAVLRLALRAGGVRELGTLWDAVVRINRALAECGAEAGHVEYTPEAGFALVQPALEVQAEARESGSRRPSSLVGRTESVEVLVAQLPVRRFVSVVGPGGIGKTTLVLATAEALRAAYADGVYFVDLAPLSEGRLVLGAVAAALGVPRVGGLADLLAFLQGRQLLIILDSCEHLLTDVAALVESFLSDALQVHVLTTSREPLRALGEWLHRLEPMRLPPRADALTAAEAASYAAIELFVERARSGQSDFELTDELAPVVAELCIKLDGVPLAIELAAARLPLLGVRGLVSQLDDRLLLTLGGSRRKPHRHRTLEAMLDWSYDLLSEVEQRVFRWLSVFRGNFNLAVAAAVIGPLEGNGPLEELILDLVAKSLASRTPGGVGAATFRLLDTTRAYGVSKLALDPQQDSVRRRHALAMQSLLAEAEQTWVQMTRSAWRARYAPWASDVRAALDWAFSTPGEDELALYLTNLAFPLADQTSLMLEYGEWAERALEVLPRLQGRHPVLEIRLRTLKVFLNLRGPSDDQTADLRMQDMVKLAEAHGEPQCQAGPLTASWALRFQNGDYAGALPWTDRLGELGARADDPFLTQLSRRTQAQTRHYLGDHELACIRAREVLESPGQRTPWVYFPSPVHFRVSLHVILARLTWMQGQPRKARELVQDCLQFARADTPLSLCQALALAAVPVALWCGDLALAARWNEELRNLETTYAARYWRPWWQAYAEVLEFWSGGAASGPDPVLLESRPAKLRDQLLSFHPRWLSEESGARSDAGRVGWCTPEVWRARGSRLAATEPREAETHFQRALQVARQQGALAWELRAALSLSELWHAQERTREAVVLLSSVRAQFVDEQPTADLDAADEWLHAWGA